MKSNEEKNKNNKTTVDDQEKEIKNRIENERNIINKILELKRKESHAYEIKKSYKYTIIGLIIAVSSSILFLSVYTFFTNDKFLLTRINNRNEIESIVGIIIALFTLVYMFISFKANIVENETKIIENQKFNATTDLIINSNDEDWVSKMTLINITYLEEYYKQTQNHASKSFNTAKYTSIAGFIIIALGIIMAAVYNNSNSTIVTASGVLTEFISSIFFYLYNKTILKMSEYHQKLIYTQNVNLGFKMAKELEEPKKSETITLIIDRITTDVNKHLSTNI